MLKMKLAGLDPIYGDENIIVIKIKNNKSGEVRVYDHNIGRYCDTEIYNNELNYKLTKLHDGVIKSVGNEHLLYITNRWYMTNDLNADIVKLKGKLTLKSIVGFQFMENLFKNCSNLLAIDLTNIDMQSVTTMKEAFKGCKNLIIIEFPDNSMTKNLQNMNEMFAGCSNLRYISFDNFDTANVMYMESMFEGCSNLDKLNLSNFSTFSLLDASKMFKDCRRLEELDISQFDTTNNPKLTMMFSGCSRLEKMEYSDKLFGLVKSVYAGDRILRRCFTGVSENLIHELEAKINQLNK